MVGIASGTYSSDPGGASGLARRNPLMALMLGALMFSLAGIPPLAGFLVVLVPLTHRARGEEASVGRSPPESVDSTQHGRCGAEVMPRWRV